MRHFFFIIYFFYQQESSRKEGMGVYSRATNWPLAILVWRGKKIKTQWL